ncbi:MAG: hypothetical protein IKQ49_06670 [Eubacterium sp.]|nr:hypothetical protein [Eubacterium sp.]
MGEEKKQIFRQQSLDRIASPEQLNDYLRTTKPGAWILLSVIILVLVAFFSWASIGRLETTVPGKAAVEEGNARIIILSDMDVSVGMTVRVGESEFTISSVDRDENGYPIANAPVTIPAGNYDVEIVVESISPISFLFSF